MSGPFPRFDSFEGHEGETFTIADPPPEVALTLTSVTRWGRPFADGARQPFTLHFHGPLEPVRPQSTYRLDHESIGPIDLFLVPLGPDEAGMRYESVFA